MVVGDLIAFNNAFFVTSWNIIRGVVFVDNPNCSHICHAIASPSLSSSVANIIFSFENFDIVCFINTMWSFFSTNSVNCGSKVSLVSIDLSPFTLRICPFDEIQQ